MMSFITVERAILVIAALVLVFVLAKLNHAIKLLHNRITLISTAQRNLSRQLQLADNGLDEKKDDELRSKLDRDFRS